MYLLYLRLCSTCRGRPISDPAPTWLVHPGFRIGPWQLVFFTKIDWPLRGVSWVRIMTKKKSANKIYKKKLYTAHVLKHHLDTLQSVLLVDMLLHCWIARIRSRRVRAAARLCSSRATITSAITYDLAYYYESRWAQKRTNGRQLQKDQSKWTNGKKPETPTNGTFCFSCSSCRDRSGHLDKARQMDRTWSRFVVCWILTIKKNRCIILKKNAFTISWYNRRRSRYKSCAHRIRFSIDHALSSSYLPPPSPPPQRLLGVHLLCVWN